MDNVEYILRIILRARDEMAAVLRKARLEMERMESSAGKLDAKLEGLNSRITSLNTRVGNVTRKIEDWRAAMQGFGKDGDDAGKSTKGLAKEVDNLALRSGRAVKSQKDLADEFSRLHSAQEKLNKDFAEGKISGEDFKGEMTRLAQTLKSLGGKTDVGSNLSLEFARSSRAAKKLVDDVNAYEADITRRRQEAADQRVANAEEALQREERAAEEAERQREQQAAQHAQILQDIDFAVQDHLDRRHQESTKTRQEEADRQAAIDKARVDSTVAEMERERRAQADTEREAERASAAERTRLEKEAADRERFEDRVLAAMAHRDRLDREIREGRGSDSQQRGELQSLAREFDKLAGSFDLGSREARGFSAEANDLRTRIKNLGNDTDHTSSSVRSLIGELRATGDNVATLDNRVRGILLLAVAAFAQQIITALVGLGGELVAVAGSAVMAGAALGASMAAAAAQALPAIGLLAGAFQRVAAVMDVFQQSQALQKAQFVDGARATQKNTQDADRLADAQDGLADAHRRVADAVDGVTEAQQRVADAQDAVLQAQDRLRLSQESLNKARADGRRELEDLIYQEKAASLAAQGASLSLAESQKALREAIAGGASALEIQKRQLDVDQARLGAGRSRTDVTRARQDRNEAVGGGVEGLDSVRSAKRGVEEANRGIQDAKRGVEDARKGVQDARESVEDANRAVTRASRNLDKAQTQTDAVAASTLTAAANLDYLLSQLSPAERRLYEAVQRIYETYKDVFQNQIYPVIIDSFTRAVDRVNDIIQMPDVIASISKLADSIATQIDKVIDSLTNPAQIDQFQRITEQAAENLGPVTDILIDIGKAFVNIAEAGNPAFQRLLGYIGGVVDKFLSLTENNDALSQFFLDGEAHLESWLDLVLAIVNLFAALVGVSAGEGKSAVDDLTSSINGAAEGIRKHSEEAKQFFSDAGDVAREVADVIIAIGKEIYESFDPAAVKNFADIIMSSVVPALGIVIRGVGTLTDIGAQIVDNPVGKELVKWGIALLILGQVATSTIGAFSYFGTMATHLGGIGKAFTGVRTAAIGAGPALVGFGTNLKTAGAFASAYAGKNTFLSRTFAFLGPAAMRAGTMMRTASAFALGPWGLAIAAVVLAIGLLLKHFGKLDDVWQGLKDAGAEFLNLIQPAVNSLSDALAGLGIHVQSTADVVKVLDAALRPLATFIAEYLIGSFKALAQILAGVAIFIIRAVTGVINIVHGLADILIGLVTLDFDQMLGGLEEVMRGVLDLFAAVIEGLIRVGQGIINALLAPFKAAWKAVKEFLGIRSPSRKAIALGEAIIDGIKDGLKGLVRAYTLPFRLAWAAAKRVFEGAKDFGSSVIERLADGLRNTAVGRAVIRAGTWIWGRLKEGFGNALAFGERIVKTIIEGFRTLPNLLLQAIGELAGQLLEVGKAIGNAIWNGIKGAIGKVGGFLGIGGDDKKNPAPAGGGGQAPAAAAPQTPGIVPFSEDGLKNARAQWREFMNDIKRLTTGGTDSIQRDFRGMRVATSASSDRMYRDVRSSLADIQTSFRVRGAAMVDSWSAKWDSLSKAAYDGLFYIGHETNRALHGMGEKTINFGLTLPRKGKAVGGWIGKQGERGMDKVLTWLGRGELVLNHWQQAAANALLPGGVTVGGITDAVRGTHAGGLGQPGLATGGYKFAPIPGMPGEEANTKIIPLLLRLIKQYNFLVTDAYDRDHSAGHKSPGHNVTGTAVDAVPGPGGSWGTIEALGRWAVAKGLTVGYGAGVPGSQPWPGHGRGQHIHIEFGSAPGGTAGVMQDLITKIGRPKLGPAASAAATFVQSAMDAVRKAANSKLAETVTASGDTTFEPTGKGAQANISLGAKMAKSIYGWVGSQFQALKRLWTGESGWNEHADNPNSDAYGIPQSLPGNKMASEGADWHDNPATQIKWGLKYIKERYRNPASALAAWNARSPHWYARGGMVDGPDGTPIGIVAHAGEWILNKFQQSRLAGLLGMGRDSLRSLMGFHGGAEASFAGGGDPRWAGFEGAGLGITDAINHSLIKRKQTQSERSLKRGLDQYADLLDAVGIYWDGIVEINRAAQKKTASAKTRNTARQKIIDAIDKITDPQSGVIKQISDAIGAQIERQATWLTRATYQIAKGGVVLRRLDDRQLATRALDELTRQTADLVGEKGVINGALTRVNNELRRVKNDKSLSQSQKDKLTQQLTGQRNQLLTNLDDIDKQIADNIQARYEAQLAEQQAFVDEINNRHQRTGAALDIQKRIASAIGNTDMLSAINQSVASNLAAQANELEGRISAARAAGATDLAQQLEDQVTDLRTQVFEAAQQAVRDAVDSVNKVAQRRLTHLDLFGRMADALGVVGNAVGVNVGGEVLSRSGVLAQRGATLEAQRGGLQGTLRRAEAAGNMGLIQELTDQLAELDVTIAENTKATFDARVSEVNSRHDYSTSMIDLQLQLLDLQGTMSGVVDVEQKRQLIEQRGQDIASKGIELQALLNDAISNGNMQAQNDLRKAILENTIANTQNTQTLNELNGTVNQPQTFSSTAWQWFRTAFFNGVGGILPTYDVPMAQAGPVGINSGIYNASTFAPSGYSDNEPADRPITGIENLTINEAGGPIDTVELGGTVSFAMSTVQ